MRRNAPYNEKVYEENHDCKKMCRNLELSSSSSFLPTPTISPSTAKLSANVISFKQLLSVNYDYNGLSGTWVKLWRISRRSDDAVG
jgi:hypothetical protein